MELPCHPEILSSRALSEPQDSRNPCPTCYNSHCVAGRMEGKYLGTQTSIAGRICGAADPGVLYTISDNAVWLGACRS